jgi:hypothetical protein
LAARDEGPIRPQHNQTGPNSSNREKKDRWGFVSENPPFFWQFFTTNRVFRSAKRAVFGVAKIQPH